MHFDQIDPSSHYPHSLSFLPPHLHSNSMSSFSVVLVTQGPVSATHIDMVVENSLGSLPLAMAPKENNVFWALGQHQLLIALRRVGPQEGPPILVGVLTVLITGAVNWARSCQDVHVNCAMATSCQVSIGQLFFPSTSS